MYLFNNNVFYFDNICFNDDTGCQYIFDKRKITVYEELEHTLVSEHSIVVFFEYDGICFDFNISRSDADINDIRYHISSKNGLFNIDSCEDYNPSKLPVKILTVPVFAARSFLAGIVINCNKIGYVNYAGDYEKLS